MDYKNTIHKLKIGDSLEYSKLIDTYHNMLCSYAFDLTNDKDLAQDIVQNVFINIWKKRSKLKDDFNLKSYLYKSVYNGFLNQLKTKMYVVPLEKKHIDVLNNFMEQEDEKSIDRLMTIVKREIENLPPKCKQTFLLSKEEGLTNIEIAEYLNVSIKSVEAHITKAFTILRKSLGDKTESILFLLFPPQNRY